MFVICGVANRLVGKKRTRSKCCQKRSNRFLSNKHFKDADNHEHFGPTGLTHLIINENIL